MRFSGDLLMRRWRNLKINTAVYEVTWICSTGPSLEAVIRLSSIPCPFCTGRYSMTFSRPPRGLEGVTRCWLADKPAGSRPSEVGLQQSETRHVEGEHGRLSNCRNEPDWLLRGRWWLLWCCWWWSCCCRDCCCSMTAAGSTVAVLASEETKAIVEVVQSLHAALLFFFLMRQTQKTFLWFSTTTQQTTRYQVCSLIKTMNHQVKRWNRSSPVKKTEICRAASQNLMPFKKTLFLIFWLGVFLLLKLEKAFWQKLPPKGSFRFNIKAGSYIGKIFYGQRRVFGRKKDFLSPKFRLTWTWPPKSPKIEGESFHSDLRSCELQ